ncbi:PDZ domain [Popillia japonica]|uniref:PDZ domain n=1 Tax=Popillia japonica TaxID=7064 RepID=A0AAW1K409_POPJA
MAEDGELSANQYNQTHQDTFQRTQEAQSEQRFQGRAGIVNVPRGSRGPRSLYIARRDDSFGFTLRHFIVYPPDSSEFSGRNAPTGVQLQPMETIFVKQVVEGGPAEQAGLKTGDRLVAVNGVPVTDKPYSEVIQFIQRSPDYLHLLVISKEEDILQKYYTEFAYNPATNQQPKQQQHPENTSTFPRKGSEIQADAISWRSLQNQNYHSLDYGKLKSKNPKEQHSADNILNSREYLRNQRSLDVVQSPYRQAPGVYLHEAYQRPRAQPQVPSNKKMGRRASEGSTFADRDIYNNCVVNQSNEMVVGDNPDKMQKNQYASEPMPHPHHPSLALAGCRLSLDAGRRDSASSLTSSLADGSKDSLSSFDSSSTVTGQDLDNPVMSRIIKSFQQKEQFLNANSNVPEQQSIQREFYGRPRKLEKQVWPPPEARQDSPSRAAAKPTHHNFQRVKNDIDSERDYVLASGGAGGNTPPQQKIAASPKDWHHMSAYKVPEAAEAPSDLENSQQINGAAVDVEVDDKRSAPPSLQIVSTRAKQFESGRSLPDDDPIIRDRMSYHRSELARISAKKVVPNVTVRAREFETRNIEPKRDTSTSSTNSGVVLRKTHRDSRSLDSSDSTNVGSTGSINSLSDHYFPRLSGNITVPIGSKYLHVPPPKDYHESEDITNVVDNLPTRIRIRSNSADSWMGSKHEDNESFGNSIDVITKEEDRSLQEAMDVSPTPANRNVGNLSPLIPESVEQMNLATPPPVLVAPTLTQKSPVRPTLPESVEQMNLATPPPVLVAPTLTQKSPVRPTQLDLAGAPKRPARHLRPPSDNLDTLQLPRSLSPVTALEDRPIVVRRNKNNTNIDEERAMRRESYLKATEVGRMHLDSDFSDGDASPQVLRSSSGSGASSSSVSLEKEKRPGSPTEREKQSVVKEGHLHCKITDIDGKRAADRSWKPIWVVLKGPRLHLYKDKHHQSPVGTASDVVEQSLSSGIDMRTSCVRIAEDYTKRKHVLRVSSILPCRTELLLQAENPAVLADWVKVLQEQVAANTDVEAKMDQLGVSKQQAVPQTSPASTSYQIQGSSRLSPQPPKSKLPNLRNRSPTGTSPVSKTRKPTQIPEAATSPKSKTWSGRLANKFRKRQGASSPTSPTSTEGLTFGIPLKQCLPSAENQCVPRIVEVCTKIVEDNGLETIGIYRVPGNNAAVTALTEEANRCYGELMPDSLLTATLYPQFIEADKIDNPVSRLEHIKKLIKSLPIHHYHTLKHLILHLKTVVEFREFNKMEAKNLAIVFGPTIVRAAEENMETMVNDMTHQCKIVESLLSYADWFFNDKNVDQLKIAVPAASNEQQESENINTTLLLDNISKVEAFKEQKDKKELFTSLIMAAQRKVKKKTTKSAPGSQDSKDEALTPNGIKDFPGQSYDETDLKENAAEKATQVPTTVTELDQSNKLWFNYKTDKEAVEQRIKNFIQETEANLNTTRKPQINANLERRGTGTMCSSASNVNQSTQLSLAGHGPNERVITKTHSASNVFSRTTSSENRNSYNSADGYRGASQHPANFNNAYSNNYNSYRNSSDNYNDRRIRQLDNSSDFQVYKSSFSDVSTTSSSDYQRPSGKVIAYGLRKGNSAENINTSSVDLNSNTNLKKIKFENETDISQRTSSLDSLHKIDDSNDENDLVKTMTKLYDEKSKELSSPLLLEIDLPFADESPEKHVKDRPHLNKENIPGSPKLYRNPSLHKNQQIVAKLSAFPTKESKAKIDKEKDEDSTMTGDETTPDNERNLSNQDISVTSNTKKININVTLSPANIKLKRSESLNKPERTSSPLTIKLKRSESLNKTGDKLKRSDSLTKTEKTESNISKRRELTTGRRTNKEFTKLKRKNGMPERSIKRRHTVGGTKDPDKVTWWDNRNQVDDSNVTENATEKTLRTSSPDLSTSRRERLLLQVNLITSQDMVATLRQHLIGSRPQSFPEATVYKLPLESHV